ncbi:metal ABC transporter permease [Candidatus Poseidoniales archaeon]|jgi:zinc transport system permease protein|nr:metal ABC transporter permease [Euryarchaeota archaeon]MDA8673331.1 metal ABC transporter permease [Candidatus Poseidoniales archaeon]MDB4758597.1 metal ABC transporter permease [Candidatus Poseidoniaceae archaeon]MDB2580911.1 metal ABC transporter permease [Candidatus Poseidoniales archaeon]MDB2587849.1 metal ABC transporter permease [Candidatus Poseidoniales archaeon]
MMGIGEYVMEVAKPVLEFIAPMVPGEIFPYFFTMEMFQRALVAAVLVTLVAGVLGSFLLVRNLALIGDGLAHVSFGGVAVGVVLGASSPLWYALVFSVVSAILIHELQTRELLTGDASIAIFLTGMLALGLVVLRVFGGGITSDIEGYLFGSLLLIDEESLDLIATISIVSLISLMLLYSGLLSTTIDPLAARVQGLPVRAIGLVFSIITAAVVVSMVQVIGALLVTALLVTPAATGGLIGRSFRSCLIWAQIFGLSSVFLGLYLSAEYDSGSGAMIALVAASIFAAVAIMQIVWKTIIRPSDNWN